MQDMVQEQNQTQESEFLTMAEAAHILDLNVITVRNLVTSGELTATNFGKGYKTTRKWLQAFIDRRTINPEMATSGK